MMSVPNLTPIIAALCQMYGKSKNGGYELFIPAEVLTSLSPTGEIHQVSNNNPKEPLGLYFQYHANHVVDGTLISSEPLNSKELTKIDKG